MEEERISLEKAKCHAEAQARAKAKEADEKSMDVEILSIEVEELTSKVDAAKKSQERMRIRLQKDAERKIAIEAAALADVTHQLHEEREARTEATKVAIAKTEEAKQRTEELDALRKDHASLQAEHDSTKTTARNVVLQMKQEQAQIEEFNALKLQRLKNAFDREQQELVAKSGELAAKTAEAEKNAQEVASLRQEMKVLKEKSDEEAGNLREEIRTLKATSAKEADNLREEIRILKEKSVKEADSLREEIKKLNKENQDLSARMKELEDLGAAEAMPKMEGRRMNVIIAPRKKKQS